MQIRGGVEVWGVGIADETATATATLVTLPVDVVFTGEGFLSAVMNVD